MISNNLPCTHSIHVILSNSYIERNNDSDAEKHCSSVGQQWYGGLLHGLLPIFQTDLPKYVLVGARFLQAQIDDLAKCLRERERERVWSTVIKSLVLQTTSTEIKPLSNLVALYHLLTFPFRYFFSGIAFLSRLLLWSLIFVCHFGSLSLWEAAWATFSEHFFASSMQDATLLPCDCLFVFGGFGEFFLMYTQTGLG